MARASVETLDPQQSLIFRITHVANVPWILENGLHCQTSDVRDPTFVPIGLNELIAKRRHHAVPRTPGGTLGDYVPFYFTPSSIMLLNIKTGRSRVIQRTNAEVVVLVSSLPKLAQSNVQFLFTDGHAYGQETEYYDSVADIDKVDWPLLRRRDFKADPEDPGKMARYQAEALAYRLVPTNALLGLACFDEAARVALEQQIHDYDLALPVHCRPDWYF